MSPRDPLQQRYREISERVAAAAERSGRSAEDVLVIAVTKTATPEQVRRLLELGHMDFGENRVQELEKRVATTREFVERHRKLTSPREARVPKQVRWHMIGHLQRNKVKTVLPLVKLIHSVDSLRVAEEIESRAAQAGCEAEVLLQLNPAGEKQKYGIAPAAAPHIVDQMETMTHVRVRGLMAIAPYTDDPETVRPIFQRTAELFEEMKGPRRDRFNILSMGMTDDFEVAIECGANVVRIGRALFEEPDDSK